MESLVETIHSERRKLEQDRDAFEKEKEAWITQEERLRATQITEFINLNVGGSLFACSVDLLRKIPYTFFSGYASGRWDLQKQKDGSIFIDRDPTAFPLIMTFMRRHLTDFDIPEWRCSLSEIEALLLQEEARFYMLSDLLKYVIVLW